MWFCCLWIKRKKKKNINTSVEEEKFLFSHIFSSFLPRLEFCSRCLALIFKKVLELKKLVAVRTLLGLVVLFKENSRFSKNTSFED